MRRSAVLFLISALLFSLKAEIGEQNHKVPLFLSFVFPGGGQIYNGRYLKAGIYAALEGVLIYGAVKQNQRMNDAKDDLEHFRDIGDLERINEYEYYVNTYTNERNNFIWMSAATVLLSAGDAFVDSHFKSFKRDVFRKGDELSLKPGINGLKFVYQW
ncbi:MAG: DUF5683 domain-containing protein [Candidatus Delongbacteria bacterium]|jgi:hypothetical protein|nr:DUF5683 domain-containing protein [Candidatus Delongbacteria bacterium]